MSKRRNSPGRRLRVEALEPRRMLSLQSALRTALNGVPPDSSILPTTSTIDTAAFFSAAAPCGGEESIESAHGPFQLAIFGDGFFIVEGPDGETLYSRNRDFRLNANFELVTTDGRRLLGHGSDAFLGVDRGRLIPLAVPLGTPTAVATTDAYLTGVLSPTFDIGEAVVADFTFYDALGMPYEVTITAEMADKTHVSRTYRWVATLNDRDNPGGFDVVGSGDIELNSDGRVFRGKHGAIAIQRPGGSESSVVQLHFEQISGLDVRNRLGETIGQLALAKQDGFPAGTLARYVINQRGEIEGVSDTGMRLLLGQIQLARFPDPFALTQLSDGLFRATPSAGEIIWRPPHESGLGLVTHLPAGVNLQLDLPEYALNYPWEMRRIQVEVAGRGYFIAQNARGQRFYSQDGNFHLNSHQQLADDRGFVLLGYDSDANFEIDNSRLSPLDIPFGSQTMRATQRVELMGNLSPFAGVGNMPGIIESLVLREVPQPIELQRISPNLIESLAPAATEHTRLLDLAMQPRIGYVRPFMKGILAFAGTRGSWSFGEKKLVIDDQTTLGDLVRFMEQAFGVDGSGSSESPMTPGGSVVNGRMRFVSQPGIENALAVGLSAFGNRPIGANVIYQVWLWFHIVQEANGHGATAELKVFDASGQPVSIQLTTVLVTKGDWGTTYRWRAVSADNQPEAPSVASALGTGTITYDLQGRIIDGQIGRIQVKRMMNGVATPFVFEIDFRQVTNIEHPDRIALGLSDISVTRQDGFGPGALARFTVSELGAISGVFANGMTQPLGQIVLARFRHPAQLLRVAPGLYAESNRSGPPRFDQPEGRIGELSKLSTSGSGDYRLWQSLIRRVDARDAREPRTQRGTAPFLTELALAVMESPAEAARAAVCDEPLNGMLIEQFGKCDSRGDWPA